MTVVNDSCPIYILPNELYMEITKHLKNISDANNFLRLSVRTNQITPYVFDFFTKKLFSSGETVEKRLAKFKELYTSPLDIRKLISQSISRIDQSPFNINQYSLKKEEVLKVSYDCEIIAKFIVTCLKPLINHVECCKDLLMKEKFKTRCGLTIVRTLNYDYRSPKPYLTLKVSKTPSNGLEKIPLKDFTAALKETSKIFFSNLNEAIQIHETDSEIFEEWKHLIKDDVNALCLIGDKKKSYRLVATHLLEKSKLSTKIETKMMWIYTGFFGKREDIYRFRELIHALSISDTLPILKCIKEINDLQTQAL